jgi:putative oxidoreductase
MCGRERGRDAENTSKAIVLVRFAVGVVFISEGIQKFLFAEALGAGRFAKIGIPWPEVMGPFVGGVETLAGLLVLLGWFARLAAVPLVLDLLVAIATTKVPILIGRGYLLFAAPAVQKTGLWSMLHESRTDLAMLCGALFLFVAGPGAWSVDARSIGRGSAGSR